MSYTLSASVDKSTIAYEETYTLSVSSSAVPHSYDFDINGETVKTELATYGNNPVLFASTGTTSNSTVITYNGSTGRTVIFYLENANDIIRYQDVGVGSGIVAFSGGITFGLTNPLYMAYSPYENLLYVLNNNGGTLQMLTYSSTAFTYNGFTTLGNTIAGFGTSTTTYAFDTRGNAYFTNTNQNYGTGYGKIAYISYNNPGGVVYYTDSYLDSDASSIAVGPNNKVYVCFPGLKQIVQFELYNDNTWNIYDDFADLQQINCDYIYVDPYNTLYVFHTEGGVTLKRYSIIDKFAYLSSAPVNLVGINNPFGLQIYQGTLYISTNEGGAATIYGSTPTSIVNDHLFNKSPCVLTTRAHYANSSYTKLCAKVQINTTFISSIGSLYPSYTRRYPGQPFDIFQFYATSKSQYVKNYSLLLNGSEINNFPTAFNYYTYSGSYDFSTSIDVADLYNDGSTTHLYIGSNSDNIVTHNKIYNQRIGMDSYNKITTLGALLDICVAPNRNVYILSNPEGNFVDIYDNELNNSIFNFPVSGTPNALSIEVDKDNNVYICDATTIYKYDSSGTLVTSSTPGSNYATRRLRLDKLNNYLYVVDSDSTFLKYNLSLASYTTITLSGDLIPTITNGHFEIDLYGNILIPYINGNWIMYVYKNDGSIFFTYDFTSYSTGEPIIQKMRIEKDNIMQLINQVNYATIYPELYASTYDTINPPFGENTITLRTYLMNDTNFDTTYVAKDHFYDGTSNVTDLGNENFRITLSSLYNNNDTPVLPERVFWINLDTNKILKESVRYYENTTTISTISYPIAISIYNNKLYVFDSNKYSINLFDLTKLDNNNYQIEKSINLYNENGSLYDMVLDSNGNIYTLFYDSYIGNTICRKYDVTGNSILWTIGPFDSGDSIAVDSSNNLYINDGSNVYKYNSSGVQQSLNISAPDSVNGLAIDNSGNIYVATYDNIYKYNSSGIQDMSFNISGFSNILDLNLYQDRYLFVSDGDAGIVYKYDLNNSNNLDFTINDLVNPSGTAIDNSGAIYVADSDHQEIIKYASNGTDMLKVFSSNNSVRFFTVDSNQNVFTNDVDNTYISKYNSSLQKLKQINYSNQFEGEIRDIKCDVSNNLYILVYSYSGNYIIVKYDNNLNYISTNNLPTNVTYYKFFIDSSTNFYITNYNYNDNQSYVTKFDSSYTLLVNIPPPYDDNEEFNDVVVDNNNGSIYVLISHDITDGFFELGRYRYNGGTSSYDYAIIKKYNVYQYMTRLAIDSSYLYVSTYMNDDYINYPYSYYTYNRGANNVYKLTLASDTYTENYVYNIPYAGDTHIEVSNSNLYVQASEGYVNIYQNNSNTIIGRINKKDFRFDVISDSVGSIYLINASNGGNNENSPTDGYSVYKYDSTGTFLYELPNTNNVSSITIDQYDNVYVSISYYPFDKNTNASYTKINKYNSSGTLLYTINNSISINNQVEIYDSIEFGTTEVYAFNYPLNNVSSMCCDANYLYVLSDSSPLIRFDLATLTLDTSFWFKDFNFGQYIRYKNNYFYIGSALSSINKYQLSGSTFTRVGQIYTSTFDGLRGFSIDSSDRVYVPYYSSIVIYEPTLNNAYSSIVSNGVSSVYIDGNDNLYVLDFYGSVNVYPITVGPLGIQSLDSNNVVKNKSVYKSDKIKSRKLLYSRRNAQPLRTKKSLLKDSTENISLQSINVKNSKNNKVVGGKFTLSNKNISLNDSSFFSFNEKSSQFKHTTKITSKNRNNTNLSISSITPSYETFCNVSGYGAYIMVVQLFDDYGTFFYELQPPNNPSYIDHLKEIDQEMIPYFLFDAVTSRNKSQVISLIKANPKILLKICNLYQRMKYYHENPKKLQCLCCYTVNWYTHIRYEENEPNVPYKINCTDLYFLYAYMYNGELDLDMYFLINCAQTYYRTLLQAQKAVNSNRDTCCYYSLDSSIINNYTLLNYINRFLVC